MDEIGAGKNRRAIIFLIPSINIANGGIISQFYIADETERQKDMHGADIFICSHLGGPPLFRNTKFPNTRGVLDFNSLLGRFTKGTEILLQIPEIYVGQVLSRGQEEIRSTDFKWNFNIMLQNIDYAPKREDIETLSKFGPTTVTAAHERYSGPETQKMLGCEIHHLSSWGSTEPYVRRPFSERQNIIIVSPDFHEKRSQILADLKSRLPDFRFITIQRMTFSDYKKLVAKAKFSLTFGEGLDGYFTEMIFSGGIGSAVYNDRFFTKEFAELPFVYPSWEVLLANLPHDLQAANTAEEFERHNKHPYALLTAMYSPEILREKMKAYYSKHFRRE